MVLNVDRSTPEHAVHSSFVTNFILFNDIAPRSCIQVNTGWAEGVNVL